MKSQTLAVLALTLAGASAQASVISQWNFNSNPADSSTGTGSTTPSIGSGTASLVGGVTGSFSSGTGSSDPATLDDSGRQTTTYAAQGNSDKSRGAQFNVSTLGFKDIKISYDLRHSNTSSRYELVQYSLDGLNFVDSGVFDGNAGDTWFNGRTVDFSSIAGVANNANFAFRVVSTFAPGSAGYAASEAGKTYATTGTWRFDMVTVNGSPVPVPATFWLFGSGLVALMGMRGRHRSSLAA